LAEPTDLAASLQKQIGDPGDFVRQNFEIAASDRVVALGLGQLDEAKSRGRSTRYIVLQIAQAG